LEYEPVPVFKASVIDWQARADKRRESERHREEEDRKRADDDANPEIVAARGAALAAELARRVGNCGRIILL
jgi:hypothetical protein